MKSNLIFDFFTFVKVLLTTHHKNFSLQFEVNLSESKLGLRRAQRKSEPLYFLALVLIRAD